MQPFPPPQGPPYRIVTPRLVLRCWEPADAPALVALIGRNLEFFREWLPWAQEEPVPLSAKLREVRKWRAEFDLDWLWGYAVLGADDGELMGGAIIARSSADAIETGGWLGREFNGRGFHTEASAALTRAAFEVLGAPRVQVTCLTTNAAVIAVRRKLGFTHEGTVRHLADGERQDEMLWGMLPSEWPSSPAATLAAEARAWDALGTRLF
jgi:RimJ/RimL family protein N-acetyltransferase